MVSKGQFVGLMCPQSIFVTIDQKGSCSDGPASWCFLGIVLESSESLKYAH